MRSSKDVQQGLSADGFQDWLWKRRERKSRGDLNPILKEQIVDLRNDIFFPRISRCPAHEEMIIETTSDWSYCVQLSFNTGSVPEFGPYLIPKRQWCLLAEILGICKQQGCPCQGTEMLIKDQYNTISHLFLGRQTLKAPC